MLQNKNLLPSCLEPQVGKSKLYDRTSMIPIMIEKPSYHKRNNSCFISTVLQAPGLLASRNQNIDFVQMNKERAKDTQMFSPLSRYYLGWGDESQSNMKQQAVVRPTNFLKKCTNDHHLRTEYSQRNINPSRDRACCDHDKKPIIIKKEPIKITKQLLICNKVQPLLKTRVKNIPYNGLKTFIIKSFQILKDQYSNKKFTQKQSIQEANHRIEKLKQTIQKVSNQLTQAQNTQYLDNLQKYQIKQYKKILATINEQLKAMETNFHNKKLRKIKAQTWQSESTAVNINNNNEEHEAEQDDELQYQSSYNKIIESNKVASRTELNTQSKKINVATLKKNRAVTQQQLQNKQKQEESLLSFEQSSCNSSSSFQSKNEINPWHNNQQITPLFSEERKVGLSQEKKPKSKIAQLNNPSKKRNGILNQKMSSQVERNASSSIRKSDFKYRKSILSIISNSNDQRRASINPFSDNKEINDALLAHMKTEVSQQLSRKRTSDLSFLKLGKKNIKSQHRSSIRYNYPSIIQNNEIKQQNQLQIVSNLISETNFLESSKSSEEENKEQKLDVVQIELKKLPTRIRSKRVNVRSSNPLCSILMLNQIQEDTVKDQQGKTIKGRKHSHRTSDFNPKYISVDSNKSFTQNAKMLSQQITKMKLYLKAHNCAIDDLFQIIEDKEKSRNPQLQRSTFSSQKFNFSTKTSEPVFINIKKHLGFMDSDDDEPDIRSRYNDLAPSYYTQYSSNQKDWLVFNEALPVVKNADELEQSELSENVKLKDMLYYNYKYC